MNFSEMADAQICQKVGEIVSRDGLSIIGANGKAFIHHYSAPVGEYGGMCLGWKEFDPCSSWADAGPIIQDNGVSLTFIGKGHHRGEWGADAPPGKPYSYGDNPLRTAMIVFLMMQEKPDAS